jgi:hypothetical protein
MREILLTQGKVALVDDEDFERINLHKWYAHKDCHTFYAHRGVKIPSQKTIIMHHEILGPIAGQMVDHINGNGLDNRKENLRLVTRRANGQNRHHNKHSKYPGVTRRGTSWQAQMMIRGKSTYLGSFHTEEEAFNEYKKVAEAIGVDVVLPFGGGI